MENNKYTKAALTDMVSVCFLLSPTGVIQQKFDELSAVLSRENLSDEQQVIQLMNALKDGLEYGNWPVGYNDSDKGTVSA